MRVTLDIPLSLKEIAMAIKSKTPVVKNEYVSAVCTDTREAKENDLFIALAGEGGSGENYVGDALLKSCHVISSEDKAGVICVQDTSSALLDLAKYYKSKLKLKYTVAVSGSVGKSTTVRFLTKILCQKYKVHATIGNFNNHIGVPLTVLAAPRDTEVIVCELGMNHRGEIARLSECINPDIGIITAVGSAHLGNLGSRAEIAKAKLEILCGMNGGTLFLPENEPLLSGVKNALYVGYNTSLSNIRLNIENGRYDFYFGAIAIKELNFFNTQEHFAIDLSYALCVALSLGLSEREIRKGIESINGADLRQRFIKLKDFVIFDDSYNASLESIVADFKYLASMNKPTGAFLGDVLELGKEAHAIHEMIGERAAEFNIGTLYLFGKYAPDIKRGAQRRGMDQERIHLNTDLSSPDVSVEQILTHHTYGEIILFKASHKLRLDKIADTIKQKEGINDARE